MSEVTSLSDATPCGPGYRGDELLPLVYAELRRLAASRLARERDGQTLQPTALVHEVWLKFASDASRRWVDQDHFFRAAAAAMRRILIDRARRKGRVRHGGHLHRTDFDGQEFQADLPPEQLLALDEALHELGKSDSRLVTLIELRFFAGLTQEQAAKSLGISRSAADRDWAFGRAWLFKRLKGSSSGWAEGS